MKIIIIYNHMAFENPFSMSALLNIFQVGTETCNIFSTELFQDFPNLVIHSRMYSRVFSIFKRKKTKHIKLSPTNTHVSLSPRIQRPNINTRSFFKFKISLSKCHKHRYTTIIGSRKTC